MKWHEACLSISAAILEILNAWENGVLAFESIQVAPPLLEPLPESLLLCIQTNPQAGDHVLVLVFHSVLFLTTASLPAVLEKIKFVLQRCEMYLGMPPVTTPPPHSFSQRPWES